jgi:hypothetical protein
MISVGCGEAADEQFDAGFSPIIPTVDSGATGSDAGTYVPPVTYDAGTTLVVDSGSSVIDAGGTTDAGQLSTDAGKPDSGGSTIDAGPGVVDAGTDSGGGFMLPDLFPRNDAGTPPNADGGAGGRDVNGPCKDLNLICFDFIDMYINAECFTCNGGKGCAGCAIPFAY